MNQRSSSAASLDLQTGAAFVRCVGDWRAQGLGKLSSNWQKLAWPSQGELVIQGADIEHLDTAGAWLIRRLFLFLQDRGVTVTLNGFDSEQQILIDLVCDKIQATQKIPAKEKPNWIYALGKRTVDAGRQVLDFLGFIGELSVLTVQSIRQPRRVQWRLMLRSIETTGYLAMPIIALLSFLIGVVLAYQMGLQLQTYGAAIYVADLLGIAILREFGPLITAIIVAGRTGSAFTAEIGTMKVNEEIDALRTMGLSPMEFLVIPKVFAMIVVMPLLILLADILGIFGGMVMSNRLFGLDFATFLGRFHEVISVSDYVFGLVKAPVFAMIIASVGCFQGFQVGGSADSVGRQTTVSVVQAIFLIIIADAFFSIVYGFSGV